MLEEDCIGARLYWATFHLAHEFQSADFLDSSKVVQLYSPRIRLCKSIVGLIGVGCKSGDLACYVYVPGFRGAGDVILTVLRFGQGAPMQATCSHTWTQDHGYGWPSLLKQKQLASEGWLTADQKIRVLVTLHLQMG